mgnify:CR=1 FL=1
MSDPSEMVQRENARGETGDETDYERRTLFLRITFLR